MAVLGRREDRRERHEADHLGADCRQVERLRVLLALLVRVVHARHLVVGQVHRDLRQVVVVHPPADALALLQPAGHAVVAALVADVERDAVRLQA